MSQVFFNKTLYSCYCRQHVNCLHRYLILYKSYSSWRHTWPRRHRSLSARKRIRTRYVETLSRWLPASTESGKLLRCLVSLYFIFATATGTRQERCCVVKHRVVGGQVVNWYSRLIDTFWSTISLYCRLTAVSLVCWISDKMKHKQTHRCLADKVSY